MYNFDMKPMSVSGIIDQTFKLYRGNFKAFILFALLIGGTANLIVALIQLGPGVVVLEAPVARIVNGQSLSDVFGLLGAYAGAGQPNLLASLLSLAAAVFIQPMVIGGINFIALSAAHGTAEVRYLPQVWSRYGKLLGTFLAIFVLLIPIIAIFVIIFYIGFISGGIGAKIIVSVAMIIAVLMLMSISAFAFPVAIQEERYGFSWLSRAMRLFWYKKGKTIGLLLLTALLVQVLSFILRLIFSLLPPLFSTVGTILVTSLLQPVSIIAMTLLYLDIRIRAEGYDLEIRLAAMQEEQGQDEQGSGIL